MESHTQFNCFNDTKNILFYSVQKQQLIYMSWQTTKKRLSQVPIVALLTE